MIYNRVFTRQVIDYQSVELTHSIQFHGEGKSNYDKLE